jgi:membrane protease YdiL (CAAX protease family)
MTSPGSDGAPVDYGLLPKDRIFGRLLWPFFFPYVVYIALGAVPDVTLRSALRLAAVGALLLFFRRHYRFGPALAPRSFPWILAMGAFATALWAVSLRSCFALPWWQGRLAAAGVAPYPPLYLALRGFNSVLLVPVFEELLCRVYIPELIQAGRSESGTSWWERFPRPLDRPPLAAAAAAASGAFFALGHDGPAVIPAALYFAFTGWVYARTRSFRAVVAIHGLVNLAIAAMAAWKPELRYLWA